MLSLLKNSKNYLHDPSTLTLLLSNIIVIVLAVTQHWQIDAFLWAYWFQSITIGFFHFFRILSLQNFSTENFKVNNQSVQPTSQTKTFTAIFFAFHYGLFHWIYAILLGAFIKTDYSFLTTSFWLSVLILFTNHSFSFFYNRKTDRSEKPNLGKLLFAPYARIIPMHLIIIISAMLPSQFILIIFLLIKTLIDILMHTYKHHSFSFAIQAKKSFTFNS